jgi:hypothetical protein
MYSTGQNPNCPQKEQKQYLKLLEGNGMTLLAVSNHSLKNKVKVKY